MLICTHNCLSGAIGSYRELSVALELSGAILQLFGTIWNIWSYLELSGTIWSDLELFYGYLELFGALWSSLELYELSEATCSYL